jgi:hypothetical protein
MKNPVDPITGIKIVYDKRIRVGDMRWDKSKRFLRMNPKTKPSLDKAITYANAPDLFKPYEMPFNKGYYMPPAMTFSPPSVVNTTYTDVD